MLSLTMPFTDVILTPKSFTTDLGEKQIRINSFKELAYLHPNWFRPNRDVLGLLNIPKRNMSFVDLVHLTQVTISE